MPSLLPRNRRAIGSAYLIDQSAGSEHVGGLEVRLSIPRIDHDGRIEIEDTLWRSDEPAGDLGQCSTEAIRGIHDYAARIGLDLAQFDVTLARFIAYDVDSMPKLYYLAAQHALATAINMWERKPPS
jgi:hypothetical protein